MQLLSDTFEMLRKRLKMGAGFRNASDDPVFYFIFDPKKMLEVKRKIKTWSSCLKKDGFKVKIFSMKQAIHDILQKNEFRKYWLEAEVNDPMAFEDINKSLQEVILSQKGILKKLRDYFQRLAPTNDTIVLITDLETLHPYSRVGTIEQELQGEFPVPTIIFYPGVREGNSLRFLGVYPPDGNYRSIHIGG